MNDASSVWERIETAARGAELRTYADVGAAISAIEGPLKLSSAVELPSIVRFDGLLRSNRAKARLIAAALQVRGVGPRGDEWPVDPFAQKPLGQRLDGQIVVIWSSGLAGPGTGVGEWQPPNDAKSDIVIQIVK